jgi:hypothetical protein
LIGGVAKKKEAKLRIIQSDILSTGGDAQSLDSNTIVLGPVQH